MKQIKLHSKTIKLNTVGPANFSSHKLNIENNQAVISPRLRSFFGEYFMLGGLVFMGGIFLLFFVDGQIEMRPFSIIMVVLGVVYMLLKRLFKRGYNKVIFDKSRDLVYSTYQKNVQVPLSNINHVSMKRHNEYGGLNDEHSGSYRAYQILLHDKSGQKYSVVNQANYDDVETMAIQIANFIGVDLHQLET